MIINPYRVDLPAVVSFSGGRTSGYLLRHILDAFDGQPDDLKVCFQNTGLEHAKTYEFIHQVETEWGVDIAWVEYSINDKNRPAFKLVNHDTAGRNGEPFTELIQKKNYLPNPIARLCTANLKMLAMEQYLESVGWNKDEYINVVGLRADEPRRVHRMTAKEGVECPLYLAEVTREMVDSWWGQQPFNLDLPLGGNIAGNCVGCFLKGRQQLEMLMKTMPEYFEWWKDAEAIPLKSSPSGGRFRNDRPDYATMTDLAIRQGLLFDGPDEPTLPCFCTD